MATTVEQRNTLEARLHDGWNRIEQAAAAGSNTSEWEVFWLTLLHDYEEVCRELDAISPRNSLVPSIAPIAQMTLGGT